MEVLLPFAHVVIVVIVVAGGPTRALTPTSLRRLARRGRLLRAKAGHASPVSAYFSQHFRLNLQGGMGGSVKDRFLHLRLGALAFPFPDPFMNPLGLAL